MQLVASLDRARGRTYGLLLRVPAARGIVVDKARRVGLLVTLSTVPAFALAALAPTFSLIAAPLLLGVPHLAADYRYLLARPRWPAVVLWLTLVGSLSILGFRAIELSSGTSLGAWEVTAALLWCGSMVAAARQASFKRRAAAALGLSLLAIVALIDPEITRLVFGYAHNLVAIALWLFLFRARGSGAPFALAAVALGAVVLLMSGDRLLVFGQGAFGLAALSDTDWFALPSVVGADVGVITSFAFLQSVHYAIWLHVIPQETLPGNRTASFSQTLRGLRIDLGLAGIAVVVLLTCVTAAGLLLSPETARMSYTSLSTFHGYMELAIGLYAWLVLARMPASPPGRAPIGSRVLTAQ